MLGPHLRAGPALLKLYLLSASRHVPAAVAGHVRAPLPASARGSPRSTYTVRPSRGSTAMPTTPLVFCGVQRFHPCACQRSCAGFALPRTANVRASQSRSGIFGARPTIPSNRRRR